MPQVLDLMIIQPNLMRSLRICTRRIGQTRPHAISCKATTRPSRFFLKVSFARPHSPYDPPARCMKRMMDRDIPQASVGKWAAKYAPRSGPKDDIWHGDL